MKLASMKLTIESGAVADGVLGKITDACADALDDAESYLRERLQNDDRIPERYRAALIVSRTNR